MASKEDGEDGLPKRGLVARLSRRNEVAGDKLSKGKQLRAELDELLRAEKDKEAALSGAKQEVTYKLYQTLYEYKSEDADDLNFEAGEILRYFSLFPIDCLFQEFTMMKAIGLRVRISRESEVNSQV
jgi:hypothetical protein